MKIKYSTDKAITPEELFTLADSQGWGNDRPITRNARAIEGSIFIASARHEGRLIGLLRLTGDGAYCLYVADFIVNAEYRNLGIGTRLLDMSIEYACEHGIGVDDNIGEFTLFTTVTAHRLYEKHGFLSVHNGMVLASSEQRRSIEQEANRRWLEEHI
jgi:GNAT superfamily N-acetyltransferase